MLAELRPAAGSAAVVRQLHGGAGPMPEVVLAPTELGSELRVLVWGREIGRLERIRGRWRAYNTGLLRPLAVYHSRASAVSALMLANRITRWRYAD